MGWCVLREGKADAPIENVPMNSGLALGKKREITRDREATIRSRDGAGRMEKEQRGKRDRERDRNSRCVEGSAFVRWAAFNPVADSGLGI